MPVAVGEKEVVPVVRSSLRKILLVCFISYLGYFLLGGWCYHVERIHEEEFNAQKLENPDFDEKGLVLELRVATSLLIFSLIRFVLLGIFLFEKDSNAEMISITWLSLATFLMMAAYFTACLNLDVFLHIHPFFLSLFFLSIAFDFMGNILVLIRNNPVF